MPRQIVLSIMSDGVTCRGCGLPEYTGDGDCYCPAADALGATNHWLQTDADGIPLCLPECVRGGVKPIKPELATCDLSRSGSETAHGLRREA